MHHTFPDIKDNILVLDNSWKTTFDSCPAKYFMKRISGYDSIFGSTALRYGSVWHKAMEGFYRSVKEDSWDEEKNLKRALEWADKEWQKLSNENTYITDYRTFENLTSALLNYISLFSTDSTMLKVIDTERKFKILLFNYNGIDVYFSGKIDLEIEIYDVLWNLDFKTTGWIVPTLLKELERSWQFIGYQYASKIEYSKAPEGTLLQIHKLASRKKKNGEYGKLTMEHHRVPLIYGLIDLKRWEESFKDTAIRIIRAHDNDNFIHQYTSCSDYGSCLFKQLCQQEDALDKKELGDRFQIKPPFDVLEEGGN